MTTRPSEHEIEHRKMMALEKIAEHLGIIGFEVMIASETLVEINTSLREYLPGRMA